MLTVGLLGGGFLLIAARRRHPRSDPALALADAPDVPSLELLSDPLLEAMASRARDDGRHTRLKSYLDDGPAIPAWVQRLDGEVNALADLKARPEPPPHDRRVMDATDESLPA
jgi:hypothetical protein